MASHLRDLVRKKGRIEETQPQSPAVPDSPLTTPTVPEFTFVRTTTDLEERIEPPSYPGDDRLQQENAPSSTPDRADKRKSHRLSTLLHRKSRGSDGGGTDGDAGTADAGALSPTSRSEKRLSSRLTMSRSKGDTSVRVPADLPDITPTVEVGQGSEEQAAAEAKWEKRATLLARGNERSRSASNAGSRASSIGPLPEKLDVGAQRPSMQRTVSDEAGDINIQEAIRLHEAGGASLERSTLMFARLAEPAGANNALAQVLYGLALRHGWGIEPDASEALTYFTYAATNSAAIESAALSSGLSGGGSAKGELVLAIYELGNSFRHGWGVKTDPVAARQYYETAANLGDVDAMAESAWCYLEGFGGKKDKFKAAQYLRRAEGLGKKEMGNSWIWKPKYDPKSAATAAAK